MGFLNFGKRKSVPEELPDLISDEIAKESAKELNSFLEEGNNQNNQNNQHPEQEDKSNQLNDKAQDSFLDNKVANERSKKNVLSRLVENVEDTRPREMREVREDGFFSDMENSIKKEIDDLDSFESWFRKKMEGRDVLSDMKNYWKNQKKVAVLDAAAKAFKERISEKISALQMLERDWQMKYFDLIEKEEEIRDAEEELKGMLNEFVKVYKHKKKRLEGEGHKIQNNKKRKKRNNIDGEKKVGKKREG